ncbi:MAG: penicillin-binding transpeptidase domain-containing protein, partial [Chloroflexota bacterium]|nr:penicillin-binding transpeptidase domain-containing protein [Chloroflexota bacterium]
LQRTAHEALAGRLGSVVLLDVQTGEVLVLASNPNYDPNQLFTLNPEERDTAVVYWQSLLGDPDRPLVLRATDGLFTPGSTFKTVAAATLIDVGIAGPDDVYLDDGSLDINGRVIVENNRPDPTVDEWTLREAVAWSLNVVFAQVGLQIGPTLLREYGDRYGFGSELPFDVPVAPSQLANDIEFLDDPVALAETAFGQGQL